MSNQIKKAPPLITLDINQQIIDSIVNCFVDKLPKIIKAIDLTFSKTKELIEKK